MLWLLIVSACAANVDGQTDSRKSYTLCSIYVHVSFCDSEQTGGEYINAERTDAELV